MGRIIAAARPDWFRWYVCGLLLLATTINYMDRQTLSIAAKRIKDDFTLNNEQYGQLEFWFGLAFAAGSLAFGFLADRVRVRWLYTGVLLAWSIMGIATGSVHSFTGLLACRMLLGWFEAAHWPCALKTTQHLLTPQQRTLGNSILQSGSAIGAIITPLVMAALLTDELGSWRFAFQVVGGIGVLWVVLWMGSLRESDFTSGDSIETAIIEKPAIKQAPLSTQSLVRRYIVLIIVVIGINGCWHFFRAWLPLFLQEQRGYTERYMQAFTMVYYIAADVGCLAAGATTRALQRRGISVVAACWWVFAACCAATTMNFVLPFAPAGYLLLGSLLCVAAGSLGSFPCFYTLSQGLSNRHQGKITGSLGAVAWITSSSMHWVFGRYVDQYHTYDVGFYVAGTLPLVALVVWGVVWDWSHEPKPHNALN